MTPEGRLFLYSNNLFRCLLTKRVFWKKSFVKISVNDVGKNFHMCKIHFVDIKYLRCVNAGGKISFTVAEFESFFMLPMAGDEN